MTEYKLKVPGQLLSSLLSNNIGRVTLLAVILNPILDAQAVEQLGAGRNGAGSHTSLESLTSFDVFQRRKLAGQQLYGTR